KSTGELYRIVVGPEVKEEETRLLVQHVAMNGCYFDAVGAQSPYNRVHFFPSQDKVARNSRFPVTGWLKIDCCRKSHRSRRSNRHFLFDYLTAAGHTKLVDAAIRLTLGSDGLIQLRCIEVHRWGRRGCGCNRQWCFAY